MELVAIENSRIISLFLVRAPNGQPFVPDVVEAISKRYRFLSYPSYEQIVESDVLTFKVGEFGGRQIKELSVYNDGIVVQGAVDTNALRDCIVDLEDFCHSEFSVEKVDLPSNADHFESFIVVKLHPKNLEPVGPLEIISRTLAERQKAYRLGQFDFSYSGVYLDTDPSRYTGKRPMGFALERHVNSPHEYDLWFSRAPLETGDHLELLSALEA